MGTRVLPGVGEPVEAGAPGLPDACGRRERFRQYAREHFVALDLDLHLDVELTDLLFPHGRRAVQPARRRAVGRAPGLARLARLSRVLPHA
ncbi:hypothetical protein [Kitasatospora viridis]|nr:hypothetical protein [Kitasatospora viridis]